MKRMLLVVPAVAMIALATATAWADAPEEGRPGPPSPRGPFGPMHLFERLGGDDGVIVLEELPEQMPEPMKQRLAKADDDGDGKVTREEFKAGVEAARKRFAEHRGDAGPHRGRRPDRPFPGGPKPGDDDESMDGPPRRPGPGFHRPPMPDLKDVFARMDRDDDGELSLEEFTEGMHRMHRHMMHKQMMHKHGPMGMHQGPHGRPPMWGPPHGRPPMWGPPHRGPWGMHQGPGGKPWDRPNAWAHGPRGPKGYGPEAWAHAPRGPKGDGPKAWAHGPRGPKHDGPKAGPGPRGPKRDGPKAGPGPRGPKGDGPKAGPGPRGPKGDGPKDGPGRGPRGPEGPQGEPPEQQPSEEA